MAAATTQHCSDSAGKQITAGTPSRIARPHGRPTRARCHYPPAISPQFHHSVTSVHAPPPLFLSRAMQGWPGWAVGTVGENMTGILSALVMRCELRLADTLETDASCSPARSPWGAGGIKSHSFPPTRESGLALISRADYYYYYEAATSQHKKGLIKK